MNVYTKFGAFLKIPGIVRSFKNHPSQFVFSETVYEKALKECLKAGEVMKRIAESHAKPPRLFVDPYLRRFVSDTGDWCNENKFQGPLEDECRKKSLQNKDTGPVKLDPCVCAKSGDDADPCQKKDKKGDPCKKKDDPCKKKEGSCGKKDDKSDPCKNVEERKKKEEECKKDKTQIDDLCKRIEEICKKKIKGDKDKKKDGKDQKQPCKDKPKKDSPCKKKEDPCKKKEDPCKKKDKDKKDDPCKKKDKDKKDDPCKKKDKDKKDDPCKKKDDPCKKDKDKKDDSCTKDKDKKDDPCKKKDKDKKDDPCTKDKDKKDDPRKKKCEGIDPEVQVLASAYKDLADEGAIAAEAEDLPDIFKELHLLDSLQDECATSDPYHNYTKFFFYDVHARLTPCRSPQPSSTPRPAETHEEDVDNRES